MGEITDEIHALDTNHPVVSANGDVQYIDLIAEYMPNLDLFGTNVYRGVSVRDMYDVVEEKRIFRCSSLSLVRMLSMPKQWKRHIWIRHFSFANSGRDLFEYSRPRYWQCHRWIHVPVGRRLGKYLQEENLDVHDTNAKANTNGELL